jgi:hypothetical protein
MSLRTALPLLLVACSAASAEAPPNRAPAVTAPATLQAREGESATATIAATDADGDALSVTVAASSDLRATIAAKAGGTFELRVDASHDEGDHKVTVTVGDGKTTRDVVVDVQVARMKWGARWDLVPQGVEEREHPATLFDAAHDRILILGGSGYRPQNTPLGDTWQVSVKSGATTRLTVEGDALPKVGSMRVAQVPDTSTAYLYGGYSVDQAGQETLVADVYLADFAGDAVKLTRLAQDAAPPARSLHGFSYDAVSKRLFVFGGVDGGSTILDDLWVGTVASGRVAWVQKTPDVRPSKRYGFFFGQYQGRTLVFSGAQGLASLKPARDLWALDTRAAEPTFTKLLEGDDVPEGRRNGCFAVDATRGRFYVYGGTPDAKKSAPGLWVYDARESVGRFTQLTREAAPPLRSSGVGVVDPRDGAAYFGFGNDATIYADLTRFGF